jgi:hypothetical protein
VGLSGDLRFGYAVQSLKRRAGQIAARCKKPRLVLDRWVGAQNWRLGERANDCATKKGSSLEAIRAEAAGSPIRTTWKLQYSALQLLRIVKGKMAKAGRERVGIFALWKTTAFATLLLQKPRQGVLLAGAGARLSALGRAMRTAACGIKAPNAADVR